MSDQQSRLKRRHSQALDKIEISREQAAALDRVATDIFTEAVRTGATMGAALAAVYLSGLQHGGAIVGKWNA